MRRETGEALLANSPELRRWRPAAVLAGQPDRTEPRPDGHGHRGGAGATTWSAARHRAVAYPAVRGPVAA